MAKKVRKQIYIEPRQKRLLNQIASKTGLSEAEIIREAVDSHILKVRTVQRDLKFWEQERDFIMHLIKKGPLPRGRKWRREELYES